MRLQHYLGGLENLGPVWTETQVFVEPWETRIFGIHTAMMALSSQLSLPETSSKFDTIWTWASLRTGAEGMNPFDYFKFRYYEKWLGGISQYFISESYITEAELDELTEFYLNEPDQPMPSGGTSDVDDRIVQYLLEGDSPLSDNGPAPMFSKGDTVVIGNPPTVEHTRLPGFLRGHVGTIETVYKGNYGYLTDTGPDGIGSPMPVYCVAFDPQELWPGNAEPNFTLYADLYSAYVAGPAMNQAA